jgi:hypothetical protein
MRYRIKRQWMLIMFQSLIADLLAYGKVIAFSAVIDIHAAYRIDVSASEAGKLVVIKLTQIPYLEDKERSKSSAF